MGLSLFFVFKRTETEMVKEGRYSKRDFISRESDLTLSDFYNEIAQKISFLEIVTLHQE